MKNKPKAISRIDEMLLEAVDDGLVSGDAAENITMRVLRKCKQSAIEQPVPAKRTTAAKLTVTTRG